MVIRQDYIKAISPYIDQPLVKILAGGKAVRENPPFSRCWPRNFRIGVCPADRIIQKTVYRDGYPQ